MPLSTSGQTIRLLEQSAADRLDNLTLPHGHTSAKTTYGDNAISAKGNQSLYFWVDIPSSGLSSQKYNNTWNISVIDLGAGINGLSYSYFIKAGKKVRYSGVEAVGQIVDLTNNYFKKQKINAKLVHGSLFDLDTVKTMIKKMPNPKVIFLFKTIDSLEMMQKDYSKKLLLELAPLSEKIVVSFATESFNKRTRFKVKRYWILSFIEENFKITDSFELGGEMYIVFENKK